MGTIITRILQKCWQALTSRTFWTIVLMVVVNTLPQIRDFFPDNIRSGIDVILGLAAAVFHINPSQQYS